jgi:hypothetical protein
MRTISNSAKESSSLAKAFAEVLTFEQEKAKFPRIRDYCCLRLGLRFKGDYANCPIHAGRSGHSLQINDETQTWQCWSQCRERCRRHKNGGGDRSQPCICRGDVLDLHTLTHRFKSKREAIDSLIKGGAEGNRLPISEAEAGKWKGNFQNADSTDKFFVDRTAPKPTLIARISKAFSFVDEDYLREHSPFVEPEAADFAKLLLQIATLPIVFRTKYQALTGARAVAALQRRPDRLQYLCSCTAKSAAGSNTLDNMKTRLFLDVEFDHIALDTQLRLIWWLKVSKGWPLISITFSGGKSYHGLFYVRGMSKARINAMKALAASLGACQPSMRATQPIRFPGGWRTREDWKQTSVGRQTLIYLSPKN